MDNGGLSEFGSDFLERQHKRESYVRKDGSLENMKQAYEQVCLEKEDLERKIFEARACLWSACGTAVEVMDRALEILK